MPNPSFFQPPIPTIEERQQQLKKIQDDFNAVIAKSTLEKNRFLCFFAAATIVCFTNILSSPDQAPTEVGKMAILTFFTILYICYKAKNINEAEKTARSAIDHVLYERGNDMQTELSQAIEQHQNIMEQRRNFHRLLGS